MSGELNYTIFDTDAGWVGILSSQVGLRRATLPQPSAQEARKLLGESANQAKRSPHLFHSLTERLRSYFAGHRTTFNDRLDLSGATLFQREVWETTTLIPYGETRSYGWVAEQIGEPGAARAVGQALGRNPLPVIIPCHRVLTSNGRLGGYSSGIETKRKLLHMEAAAMPG